MEVKNIVIGIQARSTSTRFPQKVFEVIGEKTILQHVIDSCRASAAYINQHSIKSRMYSKVFLLIPYEDQIKVRFRGSCSMQEGPAHDVLSRYAELAVKQDADYIVRITADCPLIPPFLITKAINTATQNQYDYASNVDERVRTAIDGHDVEVISKRAMAWLDENARNESDREHVTTFLRRSPPSWLKVGHIVGYVDQSSLKLSVDTPEDLERVREQYEKIKSVMEAGEAISGRGSVHRF